MKTQTETLIKALRQLSEDIQSEDGVANICVAESAHRLEELGAMIMQLRDGIAKQNMEIEQTCGKALDYPWFKDDQKNFPGATEKDGVCVGEHIAETIASELARKYTEAKERIKRLEEELNESKYRIGRLVDVGDMILSNNPTRVFADEAWRLAKEDKP